MKHFSTQASVAQVLARLACPAVQCGAITAMCSTLVNEKENNELSLKKISTGEVSVDIFLCPHIQRRGGI
jgi:hypothetical protein